MRRITTQLGLLACMMIFTIGTINAQRYSTAIGVRISGEYGLNIAQKINDNNTLQLNHEGGFESGDKTTSLHYVRHRGIFGGGLNIFTGIGVNGYYRTSRTDLPSKYGLRPSATLGAEMTLGRINLAFDWAPTLNLASGVDNRFNATTGLTVRYIIKK